MARSPSYPQIPLEQALELVRKVYKGAHTASVDTDAILIEMGYSGRSGRSLSAIGALKQFGLLEGRDDSIRVTSEALEALEPMNAEEYANAVVKAALTPGLFAELKAEFGDQVPSESVIRSIAIRKFGFTDTGAEKLAKSYLVTMDFVSRAEGKAASQYQEDAAVGTIQHELPEVAPPNSLRPLMNGESVAELSSIPSNALVFKLTRESSAQVIFSGGVTPNAIDRLIKHLELSKDAFE